MQLLTISIYNYNGDRRDVQFNTGRLNIITGESATGKSALLTIVDYCLGRDRPTVPRTKVFRTIDWYTTLWEFPDGGRAILGRRTFVGAKSNSRAMLVNGGPDLQMPDHSELIENIDSDNLRIQVGARIGLVDARLEPNEYSARGARAVGLGTASLFCLQEQEEIDGKSNLFHRQGDNGIETELRDTFPFFIGAVRGDQAQKRAELRLAKQRLRLADAAVATAERDAADRVSVLQDLLTDARAVGLTPDERLLENGDYLVALRSLVLVPEQAEANANAEVDLQLQDRQRTLESQQSKLREQLAAALAHRDLLLDQRTGEAEFAGSLHAQAGRLMSLQLIPDHAGDASSCPVCNQALPSPDATADALRHRLESLQLDLADLEHARPRRAEAVTAADTAIARIRSQLGQIGTTLDASFRERGESAPSDVATRQAFVRGRIDAILDRTAAFDDAVLDELRARRDSAESRVGALEVDLNNDDVREQTTSRLNIIGSYLSGYARQLNVEGSDQPVRLDLADLTIVVDEPTGPLPLANLGSGQNWVGYHVATHLALHRFFVNQGRPVPRFLMLDQPSQAHFQSDPSVSRGKELDPESERVRELYRVVSEFAQAHEKRMQVIVVDHANFADDWFQESIVCNWHHGEKLIPVEWLDDIEEGEETAEV